MCYNPIVHSKTLMQNNMFWCALQCIAWCFQDGHRTLCSSTLHWCSLGHGSIPSIRHKRLSIGEEGGPGTRLSTNFLSFLPIISVQFFFPQRGLPLNSVHACISFGFLVLTQTTRQEATPGPGQNQVFDILFVHLRVCEYHIFVFACL